MKTRSTLVLDVGSVYEKSHGRGTNAQMAGQMHAIETGIGKDNAENRLPIIISRR